MGNIVRANRHFLSQGESILLVIDVQEKLLPVIAEKDLVVENTTRLLRFAAEVQMPVVTAMQVKLGDVVAPVRDLLTESAPIEKSQFDCFSNPSFAKRVRALRRRALVVCGIETHICVAQTALHALGNRYHVHVVADATSSRKRSNVEIGLNRLRCAGAVVTSTEMLVYEVLGEAGTDLFRRVLPIVR